MPKKAGSREAASSTPRVREQVLLFAVSDEVLGMRIDTLKEVIYPDGLRDLESQGYRYCGEILYWGRRIPVIKLNELFRFSAPGKPQLRRILMNSVEGITVGFLVDFVHEMAEVDPRDIEPMPEMFPLVDQNYLRGFLKQGDRVVVLLNEVGLAKVEEVSRFYEDIERGEPEEGGP